MSLTFDYVTMPPKSLEASNMQTADQHRYDTAQQQAAAQVQAEVKQNSEQTIRRKEAENDPNRYDDEARSGSKQSGRQNQKKKQRGQDTSAEKKRLSETKFDIMI